MFVAGDEPVPHLHIPVLSDVAVAMHGVPARAQKVPCGESRKAGSTLVTTSRRARAMAPNGPAPHGAIEDVSAGEIGVVEIEHRPVFIHAAGGGHDVAQPGRAARGGGDAEVQWVGVGCGRYGVL